MNDLVTAKYLKDYQVPTHLLDATELDVRIDEQHTLVICKLKVRRNPKSQCQTMDLLLHGGDMLQRQVVKIDNRSLSDYEYQEQNSDLLLLDCPEAFELETHCLIKPQDNTSLEGLYKSGGMFCTQCEAEGFRNITYYLDRPDAMSVFTTRISADKSTYPILLSNGNPIESGDEADGRHYAVWHDPFPKPAYLFAMVAGDLQCQTGRFTTMSDREVDLRIYTEAHNSHKCDHAMAALKRAMAWDEAKYGREYDLDLFMIVAVDDFNMGAMENKGLNIFNSDCVLADPDSTTDDMFERIEGIVAHEYFHNWSGNRVTCRDWFQLSLKEGLTVFRDAQYTAETYSETVKRIDDVTLLRTAQFAEDSGPMAHPVRPESYMEINNFYSITVYEKGAEVVGMIHTLLGEKLFRKGTDLYFSRHDGQAVTIEDFVAAMEEVSGIDLTQFQRWYSQAGTPTIKISDEFDANKGEYWLHIHQSTPATPEAQTKLPFHIPLRLSLYPALYLGNESTQNGQALALTWPDAASAINMTATEGVISITAEQQSICFRGINQPVVPSLLRGFSAPVKLDYDYSPQQLLFLAKHDSDGFNRWEAVQRLMVDALQKIMQEKTLGEAFSDELMALLRGVVMDRHLDPAMVALMLHIPSESYLAELQEQVDVDLIHYTRMAVLSYVANNLQQELLTCYRRCQDSGKFSQDGKAIGQRALKNQCLAYLGYLDDEQTLVLTQQQYQAQANMTDVSAALRTLAAMDAAAAATALDDFYQRWQQDAQVVDLWFAIQASVNKPGRLAKVQQLMDHPAFDLRNPNKVRRVIGGFISSAINFHASDGGGYVFVADQVIALNTINPMMAAALCKPLGRYKKHTPARQEHMRQALQRIIDNAPCKDVYEVASKALV